MKAIDIIAASLLVIGGINWGLVGLADLNVVSLIFGEMTIMSRVVYALVGLAAVYQTVGLGAIQDRWRVETA